MSKPKLDDELMARMAAGDAAAFGELYAATSSIVYGFALSIVGNGMDAEDVMHDAYIRAYQAAVSYQPQGKPLAWLLTIVRNLGYNKVRQRKPTIDVQEAEHYVGTTEDGSPLERMMLQEAMDILDPQERQIVILHAVADLRHREIASILQLPLGTVMSKNHRALNKLRRELQGKGGVL